MLNKFLQSLIYVLIQESGLTDWIGDIMAWMEDIPQALLVFIVSIIIGYLTEFLNASTIMSVFMPFLGDIVSKTRVFLT